MGAISFIGNLIGDEGTTSVQHNVKNPVIQTKIDSLLGDFDSVKSKGESALSDYIARYLAGQPAAATRTGEEIGAVDRYYNGSAESDLARMRSARTKALMDATDRASKYAIANMNRSRISGQGGNSSYDTRQLMRSMDDIGVQAALDETGQARNDWGFLEGQKIGLTGRRQALADALAGYEFMPEQMRRSMYGQNLGFLSNLTNLDQANNFYGLKYKPSITESLAAGLEGDAQLAASFYGASKGGGSGGGGAGSDSYKRQQTDTNWGGSNSMVPSNNAGYTGAYMGAPFATGSNAGFNPNYSYGGNYGFYNQPAGSFGQPSLGSYYGTPSVANSDLQWGSPGQNFGGDYSKYGLN